MQSEKKYKAIVVHSGGMDSSICLKVAIDKHSAGEVLSLSFSYNQRHSEELNRAAKISKDWGVDHAVLDISFLSKITDNALTNHSQKIEIKEGAPTSLVLGRNGLMARIASIHAFELGAKEVYLGVIEVEEANSGYRDCSRKYMDILQSALRMDFDDDSFCIHTPIVKMTKMETMKLADDSGVLPYLLDQTISCYEGISGIGCKVCPACKLRNEGIQKYLESGVELEFSYRDQFTFSS